MTGREKEILDLIKKNPLISQREIADILGITRSSVGVHITNLQKKGMILGKGYIVKEDDYVVVIGGANIDIQGFTNEKLILRDSNPGKTMISLGGVGRNIAENLSNLEVNTKLITAIGNDLYGKKILEDSKMSGFSMEDSLIIPEENTSTYLSTLNEEGDMIVAISSMDILEKLSINYINTIKHSISKGKAFVLDTNLREDLLDYLTENIKVPIFLDTVSGTKAIKVKDFIGRFHTIKPNKLEAEILSGIKINNDDDLKKVGKFFLEKGVKDIFITLGQEGVYYRNENKEGKIKGLSIDVVNSTGAGDAFIAALVYGYLRNYDIEEKVKFAVGASLMAISHENTINPNLSIDNINKFLREVGLC